jgi:hypothetical protein
MRRATLFAVIALGLVDPALAYQVSCTSVNLRYQECRQPLPIANAQLSQQFSSAACVYGSSWGVRGNTLWVDGGCSASFQIDLANSGPGGGFAPDSGGYYPAPIPNPLPQYEPVPGWLVGAWVATNAAPGTLGVVQILPTGSVTFGTNLGTMNGQWENGVIRTPDNRIWRIQQRSRGGMSILSPYGNRIDYRRAN